MLTKKISAILIIIIFLVVMIGLVYFMFFYTPSEPNATMEKQVVNSQPDAVQTVIQEPVAQTKVISNQIIGEAELKKISASFVERYGSYSNQSGYKNIKELNVFMSKSMQSWASNYIEQTLSSNSDTSVYYGITTKAVVVETVEFSDELSSASFIVYAQRVENFGSNGSQRSFQQKATVDMIKEDGTWKVNRVVWE